MIIVMRKKGDTGGNLVDDLWLMIRPKEATSKTDGEYYINYQK